MNNNKTLKDMVVPPIVDSTLAIIFLLVFTFAGIVAKTFIVDVFIGDIIVAITTILGALGLIIKLRG